MVNRLGTYTYGFNGMERENEINPSVTTAQYWEYDGRLGRRWNTEPLIAKYPYLSSYACFNNNPIRFVDKNGDLFSELLGCGNWCGVTTIFGEFEVGFGIAYGFNYVTQFGKIYDKVGRTKFVMESKIYVTNQDFSQDGTDPDFIGGTHKQNHLP